MMNRSSVMQQYGTSYKRGTLFFPKKLRKDVYVVYAFVRAADQLIDTPGVNLLLAKKQLTEFHQQTRHAREGKTVESSLIQEFVTIAHTYDFSWEWVDAFFAAMQLDTHKDSYLTYRELQTYMYGSAEVIGLMMTQMIGYEGDRDKVFIYAKQLGEAMQYTNFLRDVAEDRNDHQRVYMPLERLQAHGLDYEDIKLFIQNKKADERRVAFCKQEVLFTQQLYIEVLPGVLSLDRQGRFAVWIASMLYAGILRKIEQIGYDQFAADAHTTKREKLRLFLGARKTYNK